MSDPLDNPMLDREDSEDALRAEHEEMLTNCPHTDEVRWEPTYGRFVCLRCFEQVDLPEFGSRDQDVAVRL